MNGFSSFLRRLFLCGFGLLALYAGPAEEVRAQRVDAYLSTDSVTVGQRFYLSLVVTHDATHQPVFPDELVPDSLQGRLLPLGDVEVIRRAALLSRSAAGGLRVDSLVYEVATFALDTAFVPPIPVHFNADADTFSVASAPAFIAVTSLVPPDAQDIRDLAPIADFPRLLWPWLLGGLVLLVLGALAYRYWKRRAALAPPVEVPPPPPIPPYQEAMERLQQLERTDLALPDHIKPFYIELSEVMRIYLARRLGVPAMEHTTREVVDALKQQAGRQAIPETTPQHVHSILELADFAKFADAKPPEAQGKQALEATRSALSTVEQRLHPAPGPVRPDVAPHPDRPPHRNGNA